MPTGQKYSSTAVQTTLQNSIVNSTASCTVASASGFPATPFSIVIDPGQANQEICDVTNVTGLVFSINRGVDGSPAGNHSAGAVIVHVAIGRDFREARAHMDASGTTGGTVVHGLANGSNVVGTTDTQTLTNKTLTSPVLNNITAGNTVANTVPLTVNTVAGQTTGHLQDWEVNSSILGFISGAGVANFPKGGILGSSGADVVQASVLRGTDTTPASDILQVSNAANNSVLAKVQQDGSIVSAAAVTAATASTGSNFVPTGLTGATAVSRFVGATTGGPPTSGTFAVGDMIVDNVNGVHWICTTAGTPGTWKPSGQAVVNEQVLGSAVSSVTFSSIPGYFKHLKLEISTQGTNAANVTMTFNNDTASNYLNHSITETSVANSATAVWAIDGAAVANMLIGRVGSAHSVISTSIPGYATAFGKAHTSLHHAGPFSSATHQAGTAFGAWSGTAAITRLDVSASSGTFAVGSVFTLYGLG